MEKNRETWVFRINLFLLFDFDVETPNPIRNAVITARGSSIN